MNEHAKLSEEALRVQDVSDERAGVKVPVKMNGEFKFSTLRGSEFDAYVMVIVGVKEVSVYCTCNTVYSSEERADGRYRYAAKLDIDAARVYESLGLEVDLSEVLVAYQKEAEAFMAVRAHADVLQEEKDYWKNPFVVLAQLAYSKGYHSTVIRPDEALRHYLPRSCKIWAEGFEFTVGEAPTTSFFYEFKGRTERKLNNKGYAKYSPHWVESPKWVRATSAKRCLEKIEAEARVMNEQQREKEKAENEQGYRWRGLIDTVVGAGFEAPTGGTPQGFDLGGCKTKLEGTAFTVSVKVQVQDLPKLKAFLDSLSSK